MGGLEMGWTFYNATGQRLQTSATVLATQAEMETGTALTSFVTPGRTQYHPGVAKAWCHIAADGTITGSADYEDAYNIASITDTGTGDRTVVWDTDFSQTTYTVVSSWGDNTVAGYASFLTYATGSVRIIIAANAGGNADAPTGQAAYGDQ